MAKGKKRKQSSIDDSSPSVHIFNLRGIDNGEEDDLAGCLAEFETSSSSAPLVPEKSATVVPQHTDNDDSIWDPKVSLPANVDGERVKRWNAALAAWGKTGKYEDGLLPSFDVELARHFHVEKLSKYLLEAHKEIRMPTFERWLIDARLEERLDHTKTSKADPVLPSVINIESEASQRLILELKEKISESEATRIVDELCRQTVASVQELILKTRQAKNQCPLRKADRIDLETKEKSVFALLYGRKSWKKPYCIKINSIHYNKLKDMFHLVHKIDLPREKPKITHAFHLILMTMMLRYSSLSGGQLLNDLRGGGMQGAINPKVFQALESQFGQASIECFASPFNAYFPRFGSAFGDLDWHFGSTGDFFDSPVSQGCFEANPPFSPGFMAAMAARMELLLNKADKNGRPLTFVVVVPSTDDSGDAPLVKQFASDSFQALLTMSRKHIIIKARQHGYVEGAQHIRPTRFKQSAYDTSVLFLQSKAATAVEIDELEIRNAFASQHEEEQVERKKPRI